MPTTQKLKSILVLTMLLAIGLSETRAQSVSSQSKVYELRIYTANTAKPADFQTVFRSHALPLFGKYGIENVFDATVLEGARSDGNDAGNLLLCILAHHDRETANGSWAAFEQDAEWQAALKQSQQNGPLLAKAPVSIFMTRTDFSPAWEPTGNGTVPRVFELRKYNTGPSGLARTVDQFKSGLAAILVKNGMTPIAYWTADDASCFIYLLAHKDRDTARASWSSFITDFGPFLAAFDSRVPPAPAGSRKPDDNRFLNPTDFSPRK